ncbi:unnamed protein product [Chrysoparadoxa australica]
MVAKCCAGSTLVLTHLIGNANCQSHSSVHFVNGQTFLLNPVIFHCLDILTGLIKLKTQCLTVLYGMLDPLVGQQLLYSCWCHLSSANFLFSPDRLTGKLFTWSISWRIAVLAELELVLLTCWWGYPIIG